MPTRGFASSVSMGYTAAKHGVPGLMRADVLANALPVEMLDVSDISKMVIFHVPAEDGLLGVVVRGQEPIVMTAWPGQ